MHRKLQSIVPCAILFVCFACSAAVGDTFTYQGRLKEAGQPVVGPVNLAFRLFDDAVAGVQIGPELALPGFTDFGANGEFTLDMDFGAGAFPGGDRWLEVLINGAPLTPRQPVHPTPYAIFAQSAATAAGVAPGAVPFNFSGSNAVFTGGNVGVGTTTPAHALHVVGNARVNSLRAGENGVDGSVFVFDDTGNTAIRLDADNFSAAPQFSMFGQNGTSETVELVAREGDGNPKFTLRDEAGNIRVELDAMESNGAVFKLRDPVSQLDSIYMNSVGGGELGIGTSNPATPLHIIGGGDVSLAGGGSLAVGDLTSTNVAIDANEIMARDNGSASSLFLNNNGGTVAIGGAAADPRLGVGTNNPAATLHVDGDAHIDGAITIPTTTRTRMVTAADFVPDVFFANAFLTGLDSEDNLITVTVSNGSPRAHAGVHLPDGATVTEITANVFDTAVDGDISVKLLRQTFSSGPTIQAETMATTQSVGTAGRTLNSDNSISFPVIDNDAYIYRLTLTFDGVTNNGNGLVFYGVRISYTVTEPLP